MKKKKESAVPRESHGRGGDGQSSTVLPARRGNKGTGEGMIKSRPRTFPKRNSTSLLAADNKGGGGCFPLRRPKAESGAVCGCWAEQRRGSFAIVQNVYVRERNTRSVGIVPRARRVPDWASPIPCLGLRSLLEGDGRRPDRAPFWQPAML